MSLVGVQFDAEDSIDINVGRQHISRITYMEMREIILIALMFGGKKLRGEVGAWLAGGSMEQIAEAIAPELEA